MRLGDLAVRHYDELAAVVSDDGVMVGVLAVPGDAAQAVADDLVAAGVKIIFNYSDALLDRALGRDGPHVQPGRRAPLRALLLPDLSTDPRAALRSRAFLGLLLLAAVIGALVSLLGWAFLVVVNDLQNAVFDDLPDALGFDGAPVWWPLPVLALAGAITALAITRLPGTGGTCRRTASPPRRRRRSSCRGSSWPPWPRSASARWSGQRRP